MDIVISMTPAMAASQALAEAVPYRTPFHLLRGCLVMRSARLIRLDPDSEKLAWRQQQTLWIAEDADTLSRKGPCTDCLQVCISGLIAPWCRLC